MNKVLSNALILTVLILLVMAPISSAENYVNFKGGFWFPIPDTWEKVNYRAVDLYLSMSDTNRAMYNYEAVFAPDTASPFTEDAYLVVTFDSLGELTTSEIKTTLDNLAGIYERRVSDGGDWSEKLDSKPNVNYHSNAVAVSSRMYSKYGDDRHRFVYSVYNGQGIVNLEFYSMDSTYKKNKVIFDSIVSALSFEGLREAAKKEVKFSNVDVNDTMSGNAGGSDVDFGDDSSPILSAKNIVLAAVILVIVVGLVYNFVIAPRKRKK